LNVLKGLHSQTGVNGKFADIVAAPLSVGNYLFQYWTRNARASIGQRLSGATFLDLAQPALLMGLNSSKRLVRHESQALYPILKPGRWGLVTVSI
jgi:hypothetical protein